MLREHGLKRFVGSVVVGLFYHDLGQPQLHYHFKEDENKAFDSPASFNPVINTF